ncbi:hypothetical protein T492DRAFT_207594 [Pavlovales sp. CCMP2436]|nr:hypothetical protein T492DRAFT_207594 [Pavlovales sp. CCMP2436]
MDTYHLGAKGQVRVCWRIKRQRDAEQKSNKGGKHGKKRKMTKSTWLTATECASPRPTASADHSRERGRNAPNLNSNF